jgi:iron(II)-dependent oxidoreductase
VLRGACAATSAHVVDVRYRNFFVPQRRDILAGFRSVALSVAPETFIVQR